MIIINVENLKITMYNCIPSFIIKIKRKSRCQSLLKGNQFQLRSLVSFSSICLSTPYQNQLIPQNPLLRNARLLSNIPLIRQGIRDYRVPSAGRR